MTDRVGEATYRQIHFLIVPASLQEVDLPEVNETMPIRQIHQARLPNTLPGPKASKDPIASGVRTSNAAMTAWVTCRETRSITTRHA